MPNKLTPLYSKIYYKKENYLKVKIVVFKYITPPIVKVEYVGMLVCWYILMFPHSHVFIFRTLVIYCLCDSATPRPIALLVPLVPHLVY